MSTYNLSNMYLEVLGRSCCSAQLCQPGLPGWDGATRKKCTLLRRARGNISRPGAGLVGAPACTVLHSKAKHGVALFIGHGVLLASASSWSRKKSVSRFLPSVLTARTTSGPSQSRCAPFAWGLVSMRHVTPAILAWGLESQGVCHGSGCA